MSQKTNQSKYRILFTFFLFLGVGQVVLQASASNQFKECFGVEKAETPAMYAKAMDEQFRKWMDWFGKTYTDFTVCSATAN